MVMTTQSETRSTNELVVSVRIPHGSDGTLATEAERRLSRADGVRAATVQELCGLDPGLSATVVTVRVRIEWPASHDRSLAETLTALTGVEIPARPD
ncbi:MAG: hypothetical protein ACOCYZ_00635 [Halococcoides sp.]